MKSNYFHSVKLDKEQCKGCVTCIRFCPTEAIRIRGGKAQIIEERCIDCGECIRRCPNHAKHAATDALADLEKFPVNIALPAPALYAQFPSSVSRKNIFVALKRIGFLGVYEVSLAAEYVTREIERYIKTTPNLPKPMISSACPAILRLIQVRFPDLIKNIVPVVSPVEVAAARARREYARLFKIALDKIGVWFLTPCPAKATNIRQPVDVLYTELNGAIAISSIYADLKKSLNSITEEEAAEPRATSYGVGWGCAGGEIRAVGILNSLIVHNIMEVVDILEQIEMDKLDDIDYVECLACPGGCVGGPLLPENHFVAEKNLKLRVRRMRDLEPGDREETLLKNNRAMSDDIVFRRRVIEPRPILRLDDNIVAAMKKVSKIKEILSDLPGLDCGACGSPTCASLAEDIVQGAGEQRDCIFKLRQAVGALEEKINKGQ